MLLDNANQTNYLAIIFFSKLAFRSGSILEYNIEFSNYNQFTTTKSPVVHFYLLNILSL